VKRARVGSRGSVGRARSAVRNLLWNVRSPAPPSRGWLRPSGECIISPRSRRDSGGVRGEKRGEEGNVRSDAPVVASATLPSPERRRLGAATTRRSARRRSARDDDVEGRHTWHARTTEVCMATEGLGSARAPAGVTTRAPTKPSSIGRAPPAVKIFLLLPGARGRTARHGKGIWRRDAPLITAEARVARTPARTRTSFRPLRCPVRARGSARTRKSR
jgi:hypothetical protein